MNDSYVMRKIKTIQPLDHYTSILNKINSRNMNNENGISISKVCLYKKSIDFIIRKFFFHVFYGNFQIFRMLKNKTT